MNPNRREFLRRSIHSALGGVALYSALGNLKLVAAATNAAKGAGFPDYKALVCVFLHGGNDSFNTIVPYDAAHYATYSQTRPAMAVAQADAQSMALNALAAQPGLPGGLPSDGGSYGLHPSMPDLRTLFNTQRAAIIANVGPLLGPITRAQYLNPAHPRPPQLFSHDDQANFWQTSRPDDANAAGWGGRVADLLHAGNANNQLPMTMSLGSQSLFQRGDVVDQYVMRPCDSQGGCGVDEISYLDAYQNELGIQTFNALMASGTQAHMFERAYADATRRSINTYQMLAAALDPLPTWTTPFPATSLGGQLRQVANLINLRGPAALNMQRQIFFVSLGGFDTHDAQLGTHPGLLADLSQSLRAFYLATEQMGIATQVTTFTASDFGRTLSTNGDGTDHGWGGHHFVIGGAVRGGRFFGQMPSLAQNNNPDDAGYGQIIPTTGVDPYAATLASWFGVNASGLADVFPNLGLYPAANLGFMSA
jgi:uncharacterized protein (DUF1501 family)